MEPGVPWVAGSYTKGTPQVLQDASQVQSSMESVQSRDGAFMCRQVTGTTASPIAVGDVVPGTQAPMLTLKQEVGWGGAWASCRAASAPPACWAAREAGGGGLGAKAAVHGRSPGSAPASPCHVRPTPPHPMPAGGIHRPDGPEPN